MKNTSHSKMPRPAPATWLAADSQGSVGVSRITR